MKACWCVHDGLQWLFLFRSKGSGVKAQQPSAIAQYIDKCSPGGPAAHPLKSLPDYYLMRIGNSWCSRHFERATRRQLCRMSIIDCGSLRQFHFVVKCKKKKYIFYCCCINVVTLHMGTVMMLKSELFELHAGGSHQGDFYIISFVPADLESTLSALESVHKFESVLREIYDTHHG